MRLFKRNAVMTTVHAVVAALLATFCLQPGSAAADQCLNTRWTKALKMFAYPEDYTQYYVFNFYNTPDKQVMLKLTAQFPYARYIGYTLYSIDNDDTEGNPIIYGATGAVQHLSDVDIEADDLNANPYLNDVPRNVEDRNYTIYIVKEGSSRIHSNGDIAKNTLVIPDDVSKVSLFLRVYVPDDDSDNDFAQQGSVDLPIINAFEEIDETTQAQIQCPAEAQNSVGYFDIVDGTRVDRDSILFYDPDRDKIETFRAGDYGLFPNGDCPYLSTSLVHPIKNGDKIAVLRFKAPNFPNTRAGEEFSTDDEVRYWSVCMGNWKYTTTSGCIADQDVNIDEDGFVNLVIGPDSLVAGDSRWNNLEWGTNMDPILIFRQITPSANFGYSFEVPDVAYDETTGTVFMNEMYKAAITINPENTPEEEEAERRKVASYTILEYAPVGKYCTINEFIQNRCGF